MGQVRQARKAIQAEHNDPINFCCGQCRLSQKFYKETPLVCSACGYGKLEEVEIDSGNVDPAISQ